MRRKTPSRLIACVTLAALAPALLPAHAAARAPASRAWVARYEGISNGEDVPRAIALSPDGTRVYVTGFSLSGQYIFDGARADYATVAYDTTTGQELWASRYDGPASRWDAANAIAVSPDGARVFVTGGSRDQTRDYATIAYDSSTGNVLWSDRFDGSHHQLDSALSVAISPDGTTAYVTGYSIVGFTTQGNRIVRFVTIGYDTASGARDWIARYRGAGGRNYAFKVVTAPDGSAVFVAGWGDGGHLGLNAEVVAYDAASGSELWATRHNGPRPGGEAAYDAAVAPDGSSVYVTGSSGPGFGTLALDAQTGAVEWVDRFRLGRYSNADSIAVAPDGSRVYVAGWGDRDGLTGQLLVAVAYSANDGTTLWEGEVPAGPRGGESVTVAVSPGGRIVYLVGEGVRPRSGADYVALAFQSAEGQAKWLRYYDGGIDKGDEADAAVAGSGGRLYVTGDSRDHDGRDYATIAYAPT